MQIICVSKGSQSRGEEFATKLAAKLDYQCLSREQILEEAIKRRIPIGKLETAIIKPWTFTEQLALELEHYKALATSILCERALKDNIVYHGRTGHLLLPGIGNILKLKVVSDTEYRIQYIMKSLRLSREKAKCYLEQIEDDRRRWVRNFYHVEWDVFTLYDLVLNLSQVSVDNAATAVCSMAQLPDFQATPASTNALKDLYLSARVRLLLASDKRTSRMNIKVRANDGIVYVTYPIQQAKDPAIIDDVLSSFKDAREIVRTEAETNILWIQEKFDPGDGSYDNVLSLANKWDAAVELMKLTAESGQEDQPQEAFEEKPLSESWRETGIIDESEETVELQDPDLSSVYEKLINDGRAGGKRTVAGSQKNLVSNIDRSINYRLIIFDNIFLSKGASTRKRLIQEWTNSLSDSLKIPIISLAEIQSRYKFGPRQLLRMLIFLLLTAGIVYLLFSYSPQVISILSNSSAKIRILSAVGVGLFVPIFAYFYSSVTSLFLKMIKLD